MFQFKNENKMYVVWLIYHLFQIVRRMYFKTLQVNLVFNNIYNFMVTMFIPLPCRYWRSLRSLKPSLWIIRLVIPKNWWSKTAKVIRKTKQQSYHSCPQQLFSAEHILSDVPHHLKSKAANVASVSKAARILAISMFSVYERSFCTISGATAWMKV